MAGILIYSENSNVAFELLGKGQELGKELGRDVAAAVLGTANPDEYLVRTSRVYQVNNQVLDQLEPAGCAQALARVVGASGADIVLIGSTRRGKETAARLAQKLGTGCITDVASMTVSEGKLLCQRNSLGGATVATQYIAQGIQVIAVMPGSFEPAPAGTSQGDLVALEVDIKPARVKVVGVTEKDKGSADIEGAEVLVCVGKGLTDQSKLAQVEELAEILGGLVACSKPIATDEKWLPEDRIIGLSGKKGKPSLAICLGISGQVQFTVGIRDARTIVGVNTDQNAFIFQMTDYGIVGDLNEVVPRLIAALKG